MRIDCMFSRHFSERRYKTWQPSATNQGYSCVDVSNRLLTPVKKATDIKTSPIPAAIDPAGLLEDQVKTGRFKYLADNKVEYYERLAVVGER